MLRLVLVAILGMLALAACASDSASTSSAATSSTSSTSGPAASAPGVPAPAFCADAPAESALAAANFLAQHHQSTAAVDLLTKLLASQGISSRERDCAGQALAALALATPRATPNDVQSASSDWDAFDARWVAPGARILGPFAVALVLILLLARVLTRIAVRPDTPGPSWNSLPTRTVFFWCYWLLGVGSVLYASWLASAGVAHAAFWAHPPPALTDRSIAAYVAGLFATALFTLGCQWRGKTRDAVLDGVAATAVVAVTLLATSIPLVATPPSDARQWAPTLAHALAFALLGGWIIARIRGVQIGTMIIGAGPDGAPNNAVGQLIRSRLSGLASGGPRGVQVPTQTDVSALQKDAIALLPDGALAKAATLLVQLFLPATPWLLTISQIDDLALEVSLTRNGSLIAAQLIQPATIGFPATAGTRADVSAPAAGDGAIIGDLYTAAAAFVLIELSTRYRYLQPGLNGATRWRSVAAQVIATSAKPAKSHDLKVRLLTGAVANDGQNASARLAYLFELHGRDIDGSEEFVERLEKLRTQLNAEVVRADAGRPRSAILLRVYLNLVVGWANVAAVRADRTVDGPDPDQAWAIAAADCGKLQSWLRTIKSPGLPARLFTRILDVQQLGSDIGDVLDPVSVYLRNSQQAGDVRPTDGLRAGTTSAGDHHAPADSDGNPVEIVATGKRLPWPTVEPRPTGLTAYYEWACAQAALRTGSGADCALAYLEMAATDESYRVWARRDPSFNWMRQSGPPGSQTIAAKFRAIVCDPIPGFLALEPLADHAKALAAIGINGPADLLRRSPHWLARQVCVSSGVSQFWCGLADLALMRAARDDATITIESARWLYLLLGTGITSRSALLERLVAPIDDSAAKLQHDLAGIALDYDVVTPTVQQVRSWAGFARPFF